MATLADNRFAGLALRGELRPYQRVALDAFEADRAAGRLSTHIVAPPGSGKTVVGLEIVRRLGCPALVLAPTATIQQQWSDKLALFTDSPAEFVGDAGPLHVLTYQAVCQTADPGDALRAVAVSALVAQRAAATGNPVDVVSAEVAGFSGAARERFERDVAAEIARLKRAAARGGSLDVSLESLVSDGARARVAALVSSGVRTVVLDECHHLASLWGYLVRVLMASLGADVHVIGLTATSPSELPPDEAELYAELLGPVDFEIPTPAVVRDGNLAPYQELALFTTPLQSERSWLNERHVRFAELLDRLHEPPAAGEEDLAFGPWVIGRIRYRDTGDGAARVPFATLAARRPDLARAGLRYLADAGLELPDDAPRGEGWREPPTLEDWLVLIGDYAVGCLRAHPGEAAEARFADLQTGLRDLGFVLTRQGVRRGGSDVDRVLTSSAAKPLAAIEILAAEAQSRGDGFRAVVLCDAERGEKQVAGSPLALSGGARGVMAALGADVRTAVMAPLLVTGRVVACLPRDAERLAAALGAAAEPPSPGEADTPDAATPPDTPDVAASRGGADDGLVILDKPGWTSQAWVSAAGVALAAGTTQLVVGTRGLLGEGWDAPALNVLVDLTTVAADISVRQMRGRALRLDPADGDKVASNWDVVCVAADLARGTADYERFVRRHAHLQAPCEDGSIETGVSHVHPTLSPYLPPPDPDLSGLNAAALARASDHLGARARWRIGEPYVGEEVPVLLVRRAVARSPGATGRHTSDPDDEALPPAPDENLIAPGPAIAPPRPRGPLLAFRLRAARDAYPEVAPLDRIAQAIVGAYVSLGEISATAGASLALTPRAGGTIRCALPAGTSAENAKLVDALDEALTPALGQRYVISRPVFPASLSSTAAALRALTFRRTLDVAWHPVPSDLASHKERAEAYLAAWLTHIGPADLLFAGRETAPGRPALATSASAAADYVTSQRVLWH